MAYVLNQNSSTRSYVPNCLMDEKERHRLVMAHRGYQKVKTFKVEGSNKSYNRMNESTDHRNLRDKGVSSELRPSKNQFTLNKIPRKLPSFHAEFWLTHPDIAVATTIPFTFDSLKKTGGKINKDSILYGHSSIYSLLGSLMLTHPTNNDEQVSVGNMCRSASCEAMKYETLYSFGIEPDYNLLQLPTFLEKIDESLRKNNGIVTHLTYSNKFLSLASHNLDRMYERYYKFVSVPDMESYQGELLKWYSAGKKESGDLISYRGFTISNCHLPKSHRLVECSGEKSPVYLLAGHSDGLIWYSSTQVGLLSIPEFNLCQTVMNRLLISSVYVPLAFRCQGHSISSEKVVKIVTMIWEDLEERGRGIYAVLHDLESIVMASVVAEFDDPPDDTYFNRMRDSFMESDGDSWRGDIMTLQWLKWILKLPISLRLNMTGILKITANPALSLHLADIKKFHHVNTDQILNTNMLNLVDCAFKMIYVGGYLKRFNHWPQIDYSKNNQPQEVDFCIKNNVLPWDVKFMSFFKCEKPPRLDWWQGIALENSMVINPFQVPHLFTEDKRIAASTTYEKYRSMGLRIPPGEESLILQALKTNEVSGLEYLADQVPVWRNKVNDLPWDEETGELKTILCFDCKKYLKESCKEDNHVSRELWISRMVNKSTERKIVARIYVENNFKQRVVNTMSEENIRSIYMMMEGATGLDSEADKMDKINSDAWLASVQRQFDILIINTDFKQWNAKFSQEALRDVCHNIGSIFGVEDLGYIMLQFKKNIHIHYDSDGCNVHFNQRGGHEGQLQILWGTFTLCAVEIVKEMLKCSCITHQSGDNLVMMLIFPKGCAASPKSPNFVEWKSAILDWVVDIFASLGQEIKTGETIVGRKVFVYLKKCMLAPYQIPRPMKSIVSMHGRTEGVIQGVVQMRSNQLSTLESAVRESANPIAEYVTCLYMFPMMAYLDYDKFYFSLTPKEWVVIMIGGASMTGVPALHFVQAMCKGMSSYIELDLWFLANLSKNDPDYKRIVENLFYVPINNDKSKVALAIMENEYYLPFKKPTDPNTRLRRWMLERLQNTELSEISNQVLKAWDRDTAEKLALALLDKDSNPDLRLSQQLYKSTIYHLIDQLLAKFQTTRSLRDVGACSTKSGKRMTPTIGQLCESLNQDCYANERWVHRRLRKDYNPGSVNAFTVINRDDVLKCPAAVISNIRKKFFEFECPEVHESHLIPHMIMTRDGENVPSWMMEQYYSSRADVYYKHRDWRFGSSCFPKPVRKAMSTITTDTYVKRSVYHNMQAKPAMKAAIDLSVSVHWAECGGGTARSAAAKILRHWTSYDLLGSIAVFQSITVHTRDHRMPSNNRVRDNRIICIPASTTGITVFAQPVENLHRETANHYGNYGYHIVLLRCLETLRYVWIPTFIWEEVGTSSRVMGYARVSCPNNLCFTITRDKEVSYSDSNFEHIPDPPILDHPDFQCTWEDVDTIRRMATEIYQVDQGVLMSNAQISLIIGLAESKNEEYLKVLQSTAMDTIYLTTQIAAEMVVDQLSDFGSMREVKGDQLERREAMVTDKGNIQRVLRNVDYHLKTVDVELFWILLLEKFYHNFFQELLVRGLLKTKTRLAAHLSMCPTAHIPLVEVMRSLYDVKRQAELTNILENKWGCMLKSIHQDDLERMTRECIFGSMKLIYFCATGMRAAVPQSYYVPKNCEPERYARLIYDQMYQDLQNMVIQVLLENLSSRYAFDSHFFLGIPINEIVSQEELDRNVYHSQKMKHALLLIGSYSYLPNIPPMVEAEDEIKAFGNPQTLKPFANQSPEHIIDHIITNLAIETDTINNHIASKLNAKAQELQCYPEVKRILALFANDVAFQERMKYELSLVFEELNDLIVRKIYAAEDVAVVAHMENIERWIKISSKFDPEAFVNKLAMIDEDRIEEEDKPRRTLELIKDSVMSSIPMTKDIFEKADSPIILDTKSQVKTYYRMVTYSWNYHKFHSGLGQDIVQNHIESEDNPFNQPLSSLIKAIKHDAIKNVFSESVLNSGLVRLQDQPDRSKNEELYRNSNGYSWAYPHRFHSKDAPIIAEALIVIAAMTPEGDKFAGHAALYLGMDTITEAQLVRSILPHLIVDYHKGVGKKSNIGPSQDVKGTSMAQGSRANMWDNLDNIRVDIRNSLTDISPEDLNSLLTKTRARMVSSGTPGIRGDILDIADVQCMRGAYNVGYKNAKNLRLIINGMDLMYLYRRNPRLKSSVIQLEMLAPLLMCGTIIDDNVIIVQPVRRIRQAASLLSLSIYCLIFKKVHLLKTTSSLLTGESMVIIAYKLRDKDWADTILRKIEHLIEHCSREGFKDVDHSLLYMSWEGLSCMPNLLQFLKHDMSQNQNYFKAEWYSPYNCYNSIFKVSKSIYNNMPVREEITPDMLWHLSRLFRIDFGIKDILEGKRKTTEYYLNRMLKEIIDYSNELEDILTHMSKVGGHPLLLPARGYGILFPHKRGERVDMKTGEMRKKMDNIITAIKKQSSQESILLDVLFSAASLISCTAVISVFSSLIEILGSDVKTLTNHHFKPTILCKEAIDGIKMGEMRVSQAYPSLRTEKVVKEDAPTLDSSDPWFYPNSLNYMQVLITSKTYHYELAHEITHLYRMIMSIPSFYSWCNNRRFAHGKMVKLVKSMPNDTVRHFGALYKGPSWLHDHNQSVTKYISLLEKKEDLPRLHYTD